MADDAQAQGWALKAACYAAWHTEPQRAGEAAAALKRLATVHPSPVLQALADWGQGIAALASGQLKAALDHLESAQAGFAALGDSQHAAETQVPQMVALSMLGQDAAALQRGELALSQFVAIGDERSAGKVEINLGTMLSRQDRHALAERQYRRAAVRFARSGDVELSIMADMALANSLTWQFRFDEAWRVNARVRMRAQTHGYSILLAQAHQGIGRIELNRGQWHQALPALAEAVRLLTEAGAPPQRRIEAEAALADAYLAVNLLSEAVALYDRVMAEALVLQAPTEQAWASLQRARALGRLGELGGALDGLAKARALYLAAGNAASMAFIDLCRARIELSSGDSALGLASASAASTALADSGIVSWQLEARVLRAAALAAQGSAAAARQEFESVLAQASDLPQIALECHTGLGVLARQQGDLPAARQALEAALSLVDRERAALPDDDFRSAIAANAERAHDELMSVALTQGQAVPLLADLERGRARSLAFSLPKVGIGAPQAAASTQLQWLREQWRQAFAEGDQGRLPGLSDQVRALEHDLLEAHRRETLRPGNEARVGEVLFDPAALQAALPDGAALVIWHWHDDQLLACVVRSDRVQFQAAPATGLTERIQGLRFQIDSLRFGGSALQRHTALLMSRALSHAQGLYRQVWAPIVPLLGDARRVVLVPHRALHYLPFSALHDGRQWLVETHVLSLAPSATVWLTQQRRTACLLQSVLALGVGGTGLPQVAQEIAAVRDAFGAGAQTLLDGAATLAALRAAASDVDVLHLACHGQFRADNPAFSFLQLGDGPLTLHDARQMSLRAALVTLSACETGVSRMAPGDEVLGLVRAFLLAGAGSVLATLWPVADAACAGLMADFYRRLRGGQPCAQALQQAMAHRAANGDHPLQWAAFALHGAG